MELSAYTAKLKLPQSALGTLKGLLGAKVGSGRSVQAFVLDTDGRGVWIENRRSGEQSVEVLLIKWEHVEVLGFETRIAEPEERRPIGFR